MKKSAEELSRIHKTRCGELKKIRAGIAADLGIELHQRECTHEGYCRGTCPACRQEEMRLNTALFKKQTENGNLKRRVAAAGLAAAASLCLTGCQSEIAGEESSVLSEGNFLIPETQTEGELVPPETDGELLPGEFIEEDTSETPVELEGDVVCTWEQDPPES